MKTQQEYQDELDKLIKELQIVEARKQQLTNRGIVLQGIITEMQSPNDKISKQTKVVS